MSGTQAQECAKTRIETLPRVLVLAATSIGAPSNSGITLRNLFSGWAPDSLAQIHFDDQKPDPTICGQNYPMDPKNFRFSRLVETWKTGAMDVAPGEGMAAPAGPWGVGKTCRLRNAMSAWADLLPYRIPEHLLAWLEAFQPQILYTTTGSIRLVELASHLSERFQIPIVPHFMDDWPTTHYAGNVLSFFPRIILLHKLRKMFQGTAMGFAISPYMAEAYQKQFNVNFETFLNCTENLETPSHSDQSCNPSPLRMVFAGGLHLGRLELISDFDKALRVLSSEHCEINFQIFAPASDLARLRALLGPNAMVQACGTLPPEAVQSVLANSDVLVHLESFEPRTRRYTFLSLSTKIPQYLAAGKPILIYAPREIGTSRYIQATRSGVVVGERSIYALTEQIRQLARDSALRHHLGQEARSVAASKHNAKNERLRFAETLTNLVPGKKLPPLTEDSP